MGDGIQCRPQDAKKDPKMSGDLIVGLGIQSVTTLRRPKPMATFVDHAEGDTLLSASGWCVPGNIQFGIGFMPRECQEIGNVPQCQWEDLWETASCGGTRLVVVGTLRHSQVTVEMSPGLAGGHPSRQHMLQA